MSEIKTILLPFNNSQPVLGTLDAAHRVAAKFESYIEGAYYRQLMPIIAGEGISLPGDYLADFEEEGRLQAEQAASTFKVLLEERGIPFGTLEEFSGITRAGWSEMVGTGPVGIGEYARLFDLSVVARNDSEVAANWKTTIEAVLFESGRPALVIGDWVPDSIGRRIVIAWNGSTESARSVLASMPFLEVSDEIAVVEVQGGMVSGPAAAQVAQHLSQKGMEVRYETITQREGSIGAAILEFADKWDCDLLIKGAFTHSRLRQLIFGGATREILETAPIPVLFCH
jgi:nucleotide-binding universal stress UspA family protein